MNTSPPNDMDFMLRGIPLGQALPVLRRIEAEPDKSSEYWWALIEQMTPAASPSAQ